jgi:hypothetical protein
VQKRFERSDWLQAIGGILFFFAALLPWWDQEVMNGLHARHNGFDDILGVLAFIIFVGIGILTIIIKTDSLPLPPWLLDPTAVLVAAVIGAALVAVAFVVDPFSGDTDTSRGIGLYLAAAAAVITLIGAVIGFHDRHQRAAEDFEDEDEAGDEYGYEDEDAEGYDAEEQDDLIRRINSSLERSPQRPPGEGERPPPRRRSQRAEGRAETPRGRRAAGPPIP